jgi:hypothetical protein
MCLNTAICCIIIIVPEEDILIQISVWTRWSKCSFFFQNLYRVAQKSCYNRSNILNRECPVTQHATTCDIAPPFWQNFRWTDTPFLNFASVCIRNTFFLHLIPNYSQQDATFLDLFIFTDAVHVSGGSSTHHQEHKTVHTVSDIVN